MGALNKLIESMVPDTPPLDPPTQLSVRQRCVTRARDHLAKAPTQIRFAFYGLFSLFLLYSLSSELRWISGVERERRSLLLSRFSGAFLPSFSALERLLRSVALLAYYEDSDVRQALGYQPLSVVRDDRRRARAQGS
jgi:hypothetical protein